jgi:hypothetical protein
MHEAESYSNNSQKELNENGSSIRKTNISEPNNKTQPQLSMSKETYFWSGGLSYDMGYGGIVWKGIWSISPLHNSSNSRRDDFWAQLEFEYFGPKCARNAVIQENGLLTPPSPSLFFGHFLMEDPKNRGHILKYADKDITMIFEPTLNPSDTSTENVTKYNVIGKGNSQFGHFVLHGFFDPSTGILDVFREYIADNDIRLPMTITELKFQMLLAPVSQESDLAMSSVQANTILNSAAQV